MAYAKSAICMSSRTGQPLAEFASESEARDAIEYQQRAFDRQQSCYRCERCTRWHLAPTERFTPSSVRCHCRGADGNAKLAYRSEAEAERRATILRMESGRWLRVYECPDGAGWHLTKSSR